MKVIHIPRRFVRDDWGGTETVLQNTITGMQEIGIRGEIFTTKALSNVAKEELSGVTVNRFDYSYPFWGLSSAARKAMDKKGGNLFSWALARALYNEPDIDVLHAHTGKRLGGIVRTVAKLRKIPYVLSLHGGHLDIPSDERATLANPRKGTVEWGKILGLLVGSRRVLSDANAIVCVGRSEALKMQQKYPNKRVEYLPNGVNVKLFANGSSKSFRHEFHIPQDAKLIGLISRIDPQKNQKLIVQALPSILQKIKKAHLLLAGPVTMADYHQELLALVDSLGLTSKVTVIPGFPAGDKRIIDAFHATDVFVLPSRHEPFGIVALEAWSANLPVIASNVGGLGHIISSGSNGFLFPSGDEAELSRLVIEVLSNENLAKELAVAGNKEAKEKYEWSVICQQLKRLYYEVSLQAKKIAGQADERVNAYGGQLCE